MELLLEVSGIFVAAISIFAIAADVLATTIEGFYE